MYKVGKRNGDVYYGFYVPPFEVESYVRNGFDLYKEDDVEVEITSEFLKTINDNLSKGTITDYYAKKDGISLKIQTFRIKEFHDRGYSIIVKQIIKLEDPWKEIEKINQSDAVE